MLVLIINLTFRLELTIYFLKLMKNLNNFMYYIKFYTNEHYIFVRTIKYYAFFYKYKTKSFECILNIRSQLLSYTWINPLLSSRIYIIGNWFHYLFYKSLLLSYLGLTLFKCKIMTKPHCKLVFWYIFQISLFIRL